MNMMMTKVLMSDFQPDYGVPSTSTHQWLDRPYQSIGITRRPQSMQGGIQKLSLDHPHVGWVPHIVRYHVHPVHHVDVDAAVLPRERPRAGSLHSR